jgi:hypothetical protein
MKAIQTEFDCMLEQAAPGTTTNSSPLQHNLLFIKILSLYHFIFMKKTGNISTNLIVMCVCVIWSLWKAIRITHSECVSLALVTQNGRACALLHCRMWRL